MLRLLPDVRLPDQHLWSNAMFEKIWAEFKLIFQSPRDLHRVLMVIPLAALASHLAYLYMKIPKGVPTTRDEYITFVLIGTVYTMWTAWVFLSNEFDIELFMRFVWAALLAVLAHRLGVMKEPLGGWYVTVVSFLAIGMVMVFVVTGKTKNELKIWFNVKVNEGKNDKAKVLTIAGSDDHDQSHTG